MQLPFAFGKAALGLLLLQQRIVAKPRSNGETMAQMYGFELLRLPNGDVHGQFSFRLLRFLFQNRQGGSVRFQLHAQRKTLEANTSRDPELTRPRFGGLQNQFLARRIRSPP